MKEQLVTFETAKLAKEKGFNWKNIEILEVKSKSAFLDSTTQSLLQKWLREVHGIHIYISPDYINGDALITDNLSEEELMIVKYDLSIAYEMILYDNYEQFNTYEEALEVGLQEALKLI